MSDTPSGRSLRLRLPALPALPALPRLTALRRLPALLTVIALATAALAGCSSATLGSPQAGSDELAALAAGLGTDADADDLGETPDADSPDPQTTTDAGPNDLQAMVEELFDGSEEFRSETGMDNLPAQIPVIDGKWIESGSSTADGVHGQWTLTVAVQAGDRVVAALREAFAQAGFVEQSWEVNDDGSVGAEFSLDAMKIEIAMAPYGEAELHGLQPGAWSVRYDVTVPDVGGADASKNDSTATETDQPDPTGAAADASAGQTHTGLTLPKNMAASLPLVSGEVVYSWWAPSVLDEGAGLVEVAIAVDDPQAAASWVRSALSESTLTEGAWTAGADGSVLAGFRSAGIVLLLRMLPTSDGSWVMTYQVARPSGRDIGALGVPDGGNTAACDAAYEFTISQTALRAAVARGQGALADPEAQQDMDEMFALVEPYTAALHGELQHSYQVYHAAAYQAIGQDDATATKILGQDEVQQAEHGLVLGLPAACTSW